MTTFNIATDAHPGSNVYGTFNPATEIFDDAGGSAETSPFVWVSFQTVEPNSISSVSKIFQVQAEQSADFTATAGSDGVCHEWPVNISGLAAGGILNVTSPASPSAGDRFAVFDSRLAADNGIDPPGLNRNIRVNFATDNVHSLPAPDFAAINSAGARLEFIYIDATIGWAISANVNS